MGVNREIEQNITLRCCDSDRLIDWFDFFLSFDVSLRSIDWLIDDAFDVSFGYFKFYWLLLAFKKHLERVFELPPHRMDPTARSGKSRPGGRDTVIDHARGCCVRESQRTHAPHGRRHQWTRQRKSISPVEIGALDRIKNPLYKPTLSFLNLCMTVAVLARRRGPFIDFFSRMCDPRWFLLAWVNFSYKFTRVACI